MSGDIYLYILAFALAAMITLFIFCMCEWRKLTPDERRKIREEQMSDENSAW